MGLGDEAGNRAAVLLNWWPTVPLPRTPRGNAPTPPTRWCVDQNRGINRGADVYLMLTEPAPGLVARGTVERAPFLGPRWDRVGTVGQHIIVEWGESLSAAQPIPLEVLQAELPEWDWATAGSSAIELPGELADHLDRVWSHWQARPRAGHRLPGRARSPRWIGVAASLLVVGSLAAHGTAPSSAVRISSAGTPLSAVSESTSNDYATPTSASPVEPDTLMDEGTSPGY